MNELGILKTSSSADLANNLEWTKTGTLAVTDLGNTISTTGSGYLVPVIPAHTVHLLPDWWMTVQLDNVHSTITNDFTIGIGNRSYQNNIYNAIYDVMVYIDGASQQVFVHMGGNIYPPSLIISLADYSWFDWSGAKITIHYSDFYLSILITNPSGQLITRKYRYNMLIRRPDCSVIPNTHQSNLVGGFAIKVDNGSSTSNKIVNVKIGSNARVGSDYLGGCDSLSVARQNYPNTTGYLYQLSQKFAQAGNPKDIQVLAAGGAHTVDVLNIMPSITALAPKNFILEIGDNDSRLNLAGWQPNYLSAVNQLCNVVTGKVYCLVVPPDPNDPHLNFYAWQTDTSPSGFMAQVATPSKVVLIDIMVPMCTGGNINTPNMSLLDPCDQVHWNLAGHTNVANTIYPYL